MMKENLKKIDRGECLSSLIPQTRESMRRRDLRYSNHCTLGLFIKII